MTAVRADFGRALDEARRSNAAGSAGSGPDPVSRPNVRAPVDFGPEHGGGGEARWDLAMNWVGEPTESPASTGAEAPGPASLRADTAEAIARELGFGAGMTGRQLRRQWRAFVWRNHPDRQPAHARQQANLRVALANTLYDRARRGVVKAG